METEAVPVGSLWQAVQDPRLIVAAIGIASGVLGAAATAMFKARYDLRQERRLRRQRQRDLLVAVHAEILAGVGASEWQVGQAEYDYALANSSPFATADDNDFVFRSALGELALLPAPVIHAVVEYYRLAAQSNDLTRELRTPEFAAQEPGERTKFIKGLMTVVDMQRAAGERAITDIAAYLPDMQLERQSVHFLERRRAAMTRARAREASRRPVGGGAGSSDDGNDRAAHDVSPDDPNISSKGAE
ncbi:hypothetical protein [Ancylobacter radicis]|uniref:Uncharacterized protein n=1 Tax=Ancylobacter radicis TaxID=2836179 RepID=A0ABS5RB43_9HYPH|nr:hypothetical protein [Ancylobacter radicis]MBS9478883.1 hypothetical protein [Ancylobacter radicis]